MLAVGHRHDDSQRVDQGHQLRVVFDDPFDADLPHFAQGLLVRLHLGAESLHDFLLGFRRHQQEVADLAGLQVVQVVGRGSALACDVRSNKVKFDDASEDRLGCRDRGVLAEHQACPERRCVGVVTAVLHAGQAQAATVVQRLELVEVEGLRCPCFGIAAVSLKHHVRHVRGLAQPAAQARLGHLYRVVTFLVRTAKKFPQEHQQCGLTGAGLAGHLQERERLELGTDLLGEQRAEPEGEGDNALCFEACPQPFKPFVPVPRDVLVDLHLDGLL
ncbi:hypothetical protein D3C77_353960 [compost metagenome]